MAAKAGFESQLVKRGYEFDSLNQRIDQFDNDSLSQRIEDRGEDQSFRECFKSDLIKRRYDIENSILKRYECDKSDSLRSIQNDLKKFDYSLKNTLRSDRSERSENENLENHRLDHSSMLSTDRINLSDTLSKNLNNHDCARKLDKEVLTRRIKDVASYVSCNSMSDRRDH